MRFCLRCRYCPCFWLLLYYYHLHIVSIAMATSSSYSLRPLRCSIGPTDGVCMFVWECVRIEGKHLGMCSEGFMFGSCCGVEEGDNSLEGGPSSSSSAVVVGLSHVGNATTSMVVETTEGPLQGSTTIATTMATTSTSTTVEPTTATATPETTATPPTTTQCGTATSLHSTPRIVGGSTTAPSAFPWLASVRRTSFFGFTSTHRCGGALINNKFIATAAHCVDDLLVSQIRVRLGEWDFATESEHDPHVESGVRRKVVHPSYNFFTYENDLALLELEKEVEFRANIQPICLPGNGDLLVGENATVAGWGRLSEGGVLPTKMMAVEVPIISNADCRAWFLRSGRVEHIPPIFICAGYEEGGRDSCQGDSGGPLQVRGRDGRWFLGGVISWGIGCGESWMPGVCTRVSHYRDWIVGVVQ